MNGKLIEQTFEGFVSGVDLKGMGPNSGEITLTLRSTGGESIQVFAGILDDNHSTQGTEHGLFSGFVCMISAALAIGRPIACSYILSDKPRITTLSVKR